MNKLNSTKPYDDYLASSRMLALDKCVNQVNSLISKVETWINNSEHSQMVKLNALGKSLFELQSLKSRAEKIITEKDD